MGARREIHNLIRIAVSRAKQLLLCTSVPWFNAFTCQRFSISRPEISRWPCPKSEPGTRQIFYFDSRERGAGEIFKSSYFAEKVLGFAPENRSDAQKLRTDLNCSTRKSVRALKISAGFNRPKCSNDWKRWLESYLVCSARVGILFSLKYALKTQDFVVSINCTYLGVRNILPIIW